MSWKLFFQIVLLIIIASVIMSSTKVAMYKCGFKHKMFEGKYYMQER